MYDRLHVRLLAASRVAVWIAGSLMLLAAVMVTVDVLARRFLGVTMGGSDEVSGYLFAIATAWAFPYALLVRANVRIDVLYVFTPARGGSGNLDRGAEWMIRARSA